MHAPKWLKTSTHSSISIEWRFFDRKKKWKQKIIKEIKRLFFGKKREAFIEM